MIKLIKHTICIIKSKINDAKLKSKRSSHWATMRHHFISNNPNCAVCNGTKRLNVHHIKPFHIFPELELDTNNLITLCMGKHECHLRFGHGGDFKSYCSNIAAYAQAYKSKAKTFDEICELAVAERMS